MFAAIHVKVQDRYIDTQGVVQEPIIGPWAKEMPGIAVVDPAYATVVPDGLPVTFWLVKSATVEAPLSNVEWSASAGDPPVGTGEGFMTTFRNSLGEQMVQASLFDNGDLLQTTHRVDVCGIQTVEWLLPDGSPPENVPGGSDQRIFPGWTVEDMALSESNRPDRRRVELRVTLNYPIAGGPVYFRLVDVDDPSASEGPVDENDESGDIDGDGSDIDGSDNRTLKRVISPDQTGAKGSGDASLHSYVDAGQNDPIWCKVTGADGKCSIFWEVSLKPGDNYRGVASFDATTVGGISSTYNGDTPSVYYQAGGSTYVFPNWPDRSTWATDKNLTVCRRLNVERDSMGPVTGNTITGVVAGITYPAPGQTDVNLGLNLPGSHDDLSQFATQYSGTLTITGIGVYNNIVSSTAKWIGDDHVVVSAVIPPTAVGKAYTLVDYDAVVMPELPDLGMMAEKFAPAYVLPIQAVGTYQGQPITDTNAPFVLNLNNTSDAVDSVCVPVRDLPSGARFWSVQVTGGFQPETAKDGDGIGEDGVVVGSTSTNDTYDRCVIFLVVCDETYNLPGPNLTEQTAVVHEVGHMFLCSHADGGVMAAYPENDDDFEPVSIDRVRDADKPGE